METALFVPCLAQDVCPQVAMATANVLETAGFFPRPREQHTCCGQPLYKQGRFKRAQGTAKHCIKAFAGQEPVVSPSASCVAMVRCYPALLAQEPAWLPRAEAMAARIFELCEFLEQRAPRFQPPAFSGSMLYHDSCQVRGLGVSDAVRRMLGRVPGLELLEADDPAACCGFGGVFSLDYPEISQAILEDRMDGLEAQAAQSGAGIVVTAEVSCMCNLQAGLEQRNSPLRVLHVAQVLAGDTAKGARDA